MGTLDTWTVLLVLLFIGNGCLSLGDVKSGRRGRMASFMTAFFFFFAGYFCASLFLLS